jgi:hypothetical protein
MTRKKPNRTEQLASALLARGEIPYDDAKLMTADQLISLYEWHHNDRVAEGGSSHFSNLEPMLRAEHRERTRKIDVPGIAKNKQITAAHEAFRRRMLAKEPSAKPFTMWPKTTRTRRR